MSYTPNPDWKDAPDLSTPITADKLNRLEQGVKSRLLLDKGESVAGGPVPGQYSLIQYSDWDLVDVGSPHVKTNITSKVRPTVQLEGQTGATAESMAFLSDVHGLEDRLAAHLAGQEARIAALEGGS